MLQVISMPGSEGITPCITSVEPAVLSVAGGAEADTIVVRGRNLVGQHHKLLARHQGRRTREGGGFSLCVWLGSGIRAWWVGSAGSKGQQSVIGMRHARAGGTEG